MLSAHINIAVRREINVAALVVGGFGLVLVGFCVFLFCLWVFWVGASQLFGLCFGLFLLFGCCFGLR